MNYAHAFADPALGRRLLLAIAREADKPRDYFLMEFCGGHTHALCKYGLPSLLPPNIHLVHGPGCPVCVLPAGRISQALELLSSSKVVLCSFGDMLRVPGSHGQSLLSARAQGADVRMVLGPMQALQLAQTLPEHEVVFFAIGFETTTPPTAQALRLAKQKGLKNFSILCNHVLTPPAMRGVLRAFGAAQGGLGLDAMLAPGHVSTVIGYKPFEEVAQAFGIPTCVSGFEPLDLLEAIYRLLCQLNRNEARLENGFARATTREGNPTAQQYMRETFVLRPNFEWRGLGNLPESALGIAPAYAAWDAQAKWQLPYKPVADNPRCCCAQVLLGQKKPPECTLFAKACTPASPMGACMLSPEGACSAYYAYVQEEPMAVLRVKKTEETP
ncbi:MAG: hydrogenase formation protein HypD [Cystobacterineae bacterium]|nr:hydrogenase formation protein HypD [Cystobacterineae bacterium]